MSGNAAYSENTTPMRVTKRNGTSEPVDLDKIVRAVSRCASGLPAVDPMRVATKTISGLYDGATTEELDQLSIRTAASLMLEEPQYSKLAARLLAALVDKEVRALGVQSFSQSIAVGVELGLIGDRAATFVTQNARKLDDAVAAERDQLFEFFGMRTLYDRYLLRHPTERDVLESAQYFFMRIACALSTSVAEAIELYALFSSLEYLPSSPTAGRVVDPRRPLRRPRGPAGPPCGSHGGPPPRTTVELFSLGFTSRSPDGYLPALRRCRAAVEVLWGHWVSLPPRALARLPD